eukprot:110854_1
MKCIFLNVYQNNIHLIIHCICDIAGSMNTLFGNGKTKLDSAKNAIQSIIKQIKTADRLPVVTFATKGKIIQKFEFINHININDLTISIENISDGGGTNFDYGHKESIKVYNGLHSHMHK